MQHDEIFPVSEIQSPTKGPKGLIIAGIHGDEYEPILSVMQLIRELENQLISGSLTLIPVVNLSAFLAASRVGEDGLDLARTCPGNENGSITERVAAAISERINASDFLIDMHTGGNLFAISALAGYMLHSSPAILARQREMARAFNLPIIWGTHPELEGRTLSVARDAGIPAIYTETGGGGGRDLQVVKRLCQGCMQVLAGFGMLEKIDWTDQVQYMVEDYSPQSGHLQTMYPSPVQGIFQPMVELNETIKKGQKIGEVLDYTGKTLVNVKADQNGLVFLLREVLSVQKGDALAGILPIESPGKIQIK